MSKERARRRAEREAAAALLAEKRAAEVARRERWAARRRALTGWLPSRGPRNRQSGILAERRRRQTATTVALVLAVVVLTWAFTASPAAVLLALAVGALGAPVLHTMLFRRT